MSAWFAVLAGVLLPVAIAALALRRLQGRPADGWGWAERLGGAYLFGVLLFGNLLWALRDVALAGLPLTLGSALVLVLAALAMWERRRPPALADSRFDDRHDRRWVHAGVALLGVTFALALVQAVLLPTLTWDAWNAWLAKSKAWYYAGSFVPMRDLQPWLAEPVGSVFTVTAPSYPEALPRVITWLAQCAGEWRDAHGHVLWPWLWAALGLLSAGLLKRAGARPALAIGATAFLLTLPLVSAHASLPGYADLWLAALLLLAAGNAAHHLVHRDRGSLVVAVLAVVLLPTVKLEGALYAAMLAGSYVLWRLPLRWRRGLLLVAALLLAVVMPVFGLRVPVPGLGWVALEWGKVTVPVIGTLALSWRPVAGTVAESLFLLPNWSLLWYLAPLVVALSWRRLAERPLAMLGFFLLVASAFHFMLFFFTEASAWAENLTSLNRLLLHVVPVWVYWLALLVSTPPRLRGRYA